MQKIAAQYIIRLDDACPTFTISKWERFFDIFDRYGIKPIIAVIPKNKDTSLIVEDRDEEDFWALVRKWESKGWCIALHGYDHVYINRECGITGITPHSEFVGLSLEEQTKKIKKGVDIFKQNGLKGPFVFVAPSHSLDYNTITAIKKNGISIISDGIARHPYIAYDILWCPCQLWWPKHMADGVWTICYHPETASDASLSNLESFVSENHNNFISINDIAPSRLTLKDYIFKACFFLKRNKTILSLLKTIRP